MEKPWSYANYAKQQVVGRWDPWPPQVFGDLLSSRQLWKPRKDLELDHDRNCRIRLNSYEMMNDFT